MESTQPPASGPPPIVKLDFVTPTANRHADLLMQAKALGPQLAAHDRWIVVDDASAGGAIQPGALVEFLPCKAESILFVALSYAKGDAVGTVNRARHAGCSLARPESWIVEIDDHDLVLPGAIDAVRQAILAGAVFVYGDCQWIGPDGEPGEIFRKPDYTSWLLRDGLCPCEGVRAYPARLYSLVGGYRWHGEIGVGGNEFPAGDYGLFMRIEEALGGRGFVRIPHVLNLQPKVVGGISTRFGARQATMAAALRKAAKAGTLLDAT